MAIKNTTAFTLKVTDYEESDYIVTLFGKAEGKFSGIAKGARKTGSKFGASFDLLNQSDLVYYQRPNLAFISESEIIDDWSRLKKRQDLIESGLHTARLLDLLVEEQNPAPRIYRLFYRTLTALNEQPPDGKAPQYGFYLKLLDLSGVGPSLMQCSECGRKLKESSNKGFSFERGGAVCSECQGEASELKEGTRLTMIKLLNLPQKKVHRLKLSRQVAQEIKRLLDRFAAYHLQPGMMDKPNP